MSAASRTQVVLVGGHESAGGRDLLRFEDSLDVAVTGVGRGLHTVVTAALAGGKDVVVIPMTFGRDPRMVADAAKTLRWLAAKHPHRVALGASFGTEDHLTAWLRSAVAAAPGIDDATALLVVAARSNPFDEAALHRVAYLVGSYSVVREVAVGIGDSIDDVDRSVTRLHLLGFRRVIAVPAGFAATFRSSAPGVTVRPLLSDASIARIVGIRVRDAVHALEHGREGIDEGLAADHGHGYAHSHAFEESRGEVRAHGHPHAPHSPGLGSAGHVHDHHH